MQIQKPTIKEQVIGATTGLAAGAVLYKGTALADKKNFGISGFIQKQINKNTFGIAEEDARKTLDSCGLSDKVEIKNARKYSTEELDKLIKVAKEKINDPKYNPQEKNLLHKDIANYKKAKQTGGYPYPKGSYYTSFKHTELFKEYLEGKKGRINVNLEKRGSTFFHEVGHAHNKLNGNFIEKVLTKTYSSINRSRLKNFSMPLGILATGVSALLINKTEEKPTKPVDKIKNFIKNNTFPIAMAMYSPILLEEGLASVKSIKFAKPILSAQQLKHMKIANGFAFLGYLQEAITYAGTIWAANRVRDNIVDKIKT